LWCKEYRVAEGDWVTEVYSPKTRWIFHSKTLEPTVTKRGLKENVPHVTAPPLVSARNSVVARTSPAPPALLPAPPFSSAAGSSIPSPPSSSPTNQNRRREIKREGIPFSCKARDLPPPCPNLPSSPPLSLDEVGACLAGNLTKSRLPLSS
jgi:hypothetical protein